MALAHTRDARTVDQQNRGPDAEHRARKQWVRDQVRRRRITRGTEDNARLAHLFCARVLALPEVDGADTVAAYVSTASEPGTGPLRSALRLRGTRVLLPVLRGDDDLDWALDEGPLAPGRRPGISEPIGPRLGPQALEGAAVVVCPATSAARNGTRLGQGGGSYDRALARATGLVAALVHDDEVVDELPRAPHDRPVDLVVTPTRTLRVNPS